MGLIIKDKVQYGNKSGTVRFDRAQSLTAAQQAQARDNIGAGTDYELPLMSQNVRGGAKLGRGLTIADGALEVTGVVNDAADAGPISALRAEGWAEQDGTPSPDYPQEIQVVRGRNLLDEQYMFVTKSNARYYDTRHISNCPPLTLEAGTYTLSTSDGRAANGLYIRGYSDPQNTLLFGAYIKSSLTFTLSETTDVAIDMYFTNDARGDTVCQLELGSTATPYVPYGCVGVDVYDGSTHIATIPIPLPSRGWVAALPDGTADVLTLDGAGGYVWEMGTAETTQAVTDGVTGTVGVDILSSTGEIADGATVLYGLAAPVMESGYVEDWDSAIPPHATITCPELRNLSVRCFADADVAAYGAAWYARGAAELRDARQRIALIEAQLAALTE